jgi:hypothetical protein
VFGDERWKRVRYTVAMRFSRIRMPASLATAISLCALVGALLLLPLGVMADGHAVTENLVVMGYYPECSSDEFVDAEEPFIYDTTGATCYINPLRQDNGTSVFWFYESYMYVIMIPPDETRIYYPKSFDCDSDGQCSCDTIEDLRRGWDYGAPGSQDFCPDPPYACYVQIGTNGAAPIVAGENAVIVQYALMVLNQVVLGDCIKAYIYDTSTFAPTMAPTKTEDGKPSGATPRHSMLGFETVVGLVAVLVGTLAMIII